MDFIEQKEEKSSYKKEIKESKFWLAVTDEIISNLDSIIEVKNNQLSFESLSLYSTFRYLVGYSQTSKIKYRNFQDQLLGAISNQVSDEVEYIIDSSKSWRNTFFRPIALSKFTQYEVKVIHLVRDGRGFMWSTMKGSNRKMEQGVNPSIPFAALRATINWLLTNTGAHLFQLFSSGKNYYRLRYEDLVEKPEMIFNQISHFIDIDLNQQITLIKEGKEIPIANQITGNRLRKQEKIILKLDSAWKTSLKWHHKLLFWLIDWPYALLYGYK